MANRRQTAIRPKGRFNPDAWLRAAAQSSMATALRKRFMDTPAKTAQQYKKRRMAKPRKVSGFGGRLGRKFKKGRKTKIWNSKVKRNSLSTLAKIQANGILYTKEVGVSTTGVSDAVYLGHATFAMLQYKAILIATLVKRAFAKIGIVMKNISDIPFPGVLVGDQLTIEFRTNQDILAAPATVSSTMTATQTFSQIIDTFVNNSSLWINDDSQLLRMYWQFNGGSNTQRFIQLQNASIEVYCKSSLKLQNATTSAAGSEADEVDNVPIAGKNYFGFGTGTTSGRSERIEEQFWGREDCGFMKHVPTPGGGLIEMPSASYFRNVKKMGKHRLNPGTINYSVLKDHYKVSLNWLFTKLQQRVDHVTDVSQLGKFKFYGFEHVIKAASDSPAIKVLGEVNYQLGMVLTEKYSNVTDQIVAQGYLAY